MVQGMNNKLMGYEYNYEKETNIDCHPYRVWYAIFRMRTFQGQEHEMFALSKQSTEGCGC